MYSTELDEVTRVRKMKQGALVGRQNFRLWKGRRGRDEVYAAATHNNQAAQCPPSGAVFWHLTIQEALAAAIRLEC